MKSLQPLRILLIVFSLAVAAMASTRLGIPVLARMAVLLALAIVATALSLKQDPKDNWMRYSRALIVVAFVFLTRVVSPGAPALGMIALAMLSAALLAGGAAQLVVAFAAAARDDDKASSELGPADIWLLNLGVLCALAWAVAALAGGDGLARAGANLIAALGLTGLFFLTAGAVRSRATVAAWSFFAIASLLLVLGMGFLRGYRAHRVLDAGRRSIEAGAPARALLAAQKAHEMNATLQWDALRRNYVRLQRDAWLAQGRRPEALRTTGLSIALWYEPQVLTSDGEEQFEFLKRYVAQKPLEPLIAKYASLDQMKRFLRLHDELRPIPEEVELLHQLFLYNGYIDRLAERYATAGLPPMRQGGAFIEALERIAITSENDAHRSTRARYLLGVVRFASRQFAQAQAEFEAVLAAWPDDHNTLTFLERLAEARNDTEEMKRLEALPHRVVFSRMTGKKKDYNVDDTLWTALEVRKGDYAISIDLSARPEQGVWSRVSVFVGEEASPAFSEQVETTDWRAYEFEHTFRQSGRSRLLIVFENDLYVDRGPGKDALNRNLYFRSMRVTRR